MNQRTVLQWLIFQKIFLSFSRSSFLSSYLVKISTIRKFLSWLALLTRASSLKILQWAKLLKKSLNRRPWQWRHELLIHFGKQSISWQVRTPHSPIWKEFQTKTDSLFAKLFANISKRECLAKPRALSEIIAIWFQSFFNHLTFLTKRQSLMKFSISFSLEHRLFG